MEYRTVGYLKNLFAAAGLPEPKAQFFTVAYEMEQQIAKSFPVDDDREGLRRTIVESIEGDTMGLNARAEGGRCSSPTRPWCWSRRGRAVDRHCEARNAAAIQGPRTRVAPLCSQ